MRYDRRKKHGKKLLIAYAVRALIVLIALSIIALVTGVVILITSLAKGNESDAASSQLTVSTDSDTGYDVSDVSTDVSTDVSSVFSNLTSSSAVSSTTPAVASVTPGKVTKPVGDTTVFIDPGHGGKDPGTDKQPVYEKVIALDVSLKLKAKLEAKGYKVVMSRTEDVYPTLDRRVKMANESGADYLVCVHCNSFTDSTVRGFDSYYYNSDEGKALATSILNAVRNVAKVRDVQENNLKLLREVDMISTYLEIGFLTCPEEYKLLTSADYQDKLAGAIADGIDNYHSS